MKTFLITLATTIALNVGSYYFWRTEFEKRYNYNRDELCTSAAELGITTAIKVTMFSTGMSYEPYGGQELIRKRCQNDIDRLVPAVKWRWAHSFELAAQ